MGCVCVSLYLSAESSPWRKRTEKVDRALCRRLDSRLCYWGSSLCWASCGTDWDVVCLFGGPNRFPFTKRNSRNSPSDIGRHLDPYIYLVSRLCLDSCPRIGTIFVKNSVRDKRAHRFSKFMERKCSILLPQTSGDRSVSCVRPISPNF